MPGFFDAVNNSPPVKKKVHTVCISGQNVVVTLERKLEVIKHGEEAYHWISPTEFALKPPPSRQGIVYRTLERKDPGYVFHKGDPHWPIGIEQGGYTWQIKSE